jgi:MFS family permease
MLFKEEAMLKSSSPRKLGKIDRSQLAPIVLVANAFIWYFYAFNMIREHIDSSGLSNSDSIIIWGTNFIAIALSAIIGAKLIEKSVGRLRFLMAWTAVGVAISLIPLIDSLTTFSSLARVSAIFGVYFGLGMPVCMGYYAKSTAPQNRAQLGGITFLTVGLGFFLLGMIGVENLSIQASILSLWRVIGLISILLLKPNEIPFEKKETVRYQSVLSDRSFILYFIPWLIFSLINFMTVPITNSFFTEEISRNLSMFENVAIAISAVVGGFFADRYGRKRLAMLGFAMMGVSYAVLGLTQNAASGVNIYSYCFFTIADGVSWGVFFNLFLVTVWGDVGQGKSSEKFYAIGSLPYLLANFMRILVGSYVADIVPIVTIFSFASFFLFVAVLPLYYAPETLPEEIIKKRELKTYLKKAQEIAAKVHENEEETTEKENEAAELEFEVKQEERDKAEELAEKYY